MSSRKDRLKRYAPVLIALALVAGYAVYDRSLTESDVLTELSWTQPLETEGDEELLDLAGYNIHCWGGAGRYTIQVHIDDPSVTHFAMEGLPPGRYQCAVSAYTQDGLESALSNVVTRTIE